MPDNALAYYSANYDLCIYLKKTFSYLKVMHLLPQQALAEDAVSFYHHETVALLPTF